MISVSLSLQPRAAAAVLTLGVECMALKELRALQARILPSNCLLDALDLGRIIFMFECVIIFCPQCKKRPSV
jgi:hypothetical protein